MRTVAYIVLIWRGFVFCDDVVTYILIANDISITVPYCRGFTFAVDVNLEPTDTRRVGEQAALVFAWLALGDASQTRKS